MDHMIALFGETVAGSADTVGRAADERMRCDGLVEAPNAHADRAASLRRHLRAAHASIAATGASAEDAAAVLGLAREVLGGVWGTLWDDAAACRAVAVDHVQRNRDMYARRGALWVWDVLGRTLGVTPPTGDEAY